MSPDPFRRRYGHGAAQIPIGIPSGVLSLSALSRTPAEAENAVATAPVLSFIAMVLLFAMTIRLTPERSSQPLPLALVERRELELEFLEEPPVVSPSSRHEASRPVTPSRPVPIAQPIAPPPTMSRIASKAPVDSSRPFDPRLVAMKPIGEPVPESGPSRPVARPTARPSPRRATAPTPPLSIAGLSEWRPTRAEGADPASARRPERSRPTPDPGDAKDPALLPEWIAKRNERRTFLAEVAALEARGSNAVRAMARRPAVAAASRSTKSPIPRALRTNPFTDPASAGWLEVPLDELPDCTPPGRQDLLKKRILLAAPSERECSNRDGSYRFVETRNLGAFLMWSRTHPGRSANRKPIRDACDVLEQALRCLHESSTKEFNPR